MILSPILPSTCARGYSRPSAERRLFFSALLGNECNRHRYGRRCSKTVTWTRYAEERIERPRVWSARLDSPALQRRGDLRLRRGGQARARIASGGKESLSGPGRPRGIFSPLQRRRGIWRQSDL